MNANFGDVLTQATGAAKHFGVSTYIYRLTQPWSYEWDYNGSKIGDGFVCLRVDRNGVEFTPDDSGFAAEG